MNNNVTIVLTNNNSTYNSSITGYFLYTTANTKIIEIISGDGGDDGGGEGGGGEGGGGEGGGGGTQGGGPCGAWLCGAWL